MYEKQNNMNPTINCYIYLPESRDNDDNNLNFSAFQYFFFLFKNFEFTHLHGRQHQIHVRLLSL